MRREFRKLNPIAQQKRDERILYLFDQGVAIAAIAVRVGLSYHGVRSVLGRLKRHENPSEAASLSFASEMQAQPSAQDA